MARTRVKICGVMRPDDARMAVEAGADAIGIVMHQKAGRYVEPRAAREIVRAIGAFVSPVGLFVNGGDEYVREDCGVAGIADVQLHGQEKPVDVVRLEGLRVIKAIRVDERFAEELAMWREAVAEMHITNLAGVVLETAGVEGGSGVENNWEKVRHQMDLGAFDGLGSVIVAGGLRVENVADVVRLLRPYAVDVSSGVEVVRGQKDRGLVERFIGEVAGALR